MLTSNPLRSAIKQSMRKREYNFSALSEKSGISRGALSLIFVGGASRRSLISFHHLTKITEALGLPEDAFFVLYIDECFFGGRPGRSRIEPFLERCIELGHSNCVDETLRRLNGDPRYLPILFKIAERRNKQEANPLIERLYEYLLSHDGDRHSIEKAICHYRLFLLRLNEDEENNSKELNAFWPYRGNLPNELKLDALTVMGSLCFNQMDAGRLEKLADEMIELCLRLFGSADRPPCCPFRPEHPLRQPAVVYYGQGYFMKQVAYCEKEAFGEAEAFSESYENLGWLAGSDAQAKKAAEELSLFAQANRVGCRLMNGQLEALPEFARLLEAHPKETIPGLIVLLKTANRFQVSVDAYLRRFPVELQRMLDMQDNKHAKQVSRNRFARLLYQLSIYHFNRGRFEESLQAALQSWELSHQLNNHRMFRMLASLTLMYSGQSEPNDL